jgi:hypothetical protein
MPVFRGDGYNSFFVPLLLKPRNLQLQGVDFILQFLDGYKLVGSNGMAGQGAFALLQFFLECLDPILNLQRISFFHLAAFLLNAPQFLMWMRSPPGPEEIMMAAPMVMPIPMTMRVAISHSYSGFFHHGTPAELEGTAWVSLDEEISACGSFWDGLLGLWEQAEVTQRKTNAKRRLRPLLRSRVRPIISSRGVTTGSLLDFNNNYSNILIKKSETKEKRF